MTSSKTSSAKLLLLAVIISIIIPSVSADNPCCDLGYHNSYVKLKFFDENQNILKNELVTITPIRYQPYSYEMLFWIFGVGYRPDTSRQTQFYTDDNGTIIDSVDRLTKYQITCRNFHLEVYLLHDEYSIGIPNCNVTGIEGCS